MHLTLFSSCLCESRTRLANALTFLTSLGSVVAVRSSLLRLLASSSSLSSLQIKSNIFGQAYGLTSRPNGSIEVEDNESVATVVKTTLPATSEDHLAKLRADLEKAPANIWNDLLKPLFLQHIEKEVSPRNCAI
ncbi:unnamed protein product [Protopolystoma xenopodis]|uniref:Uncharacterized protein n=1 Tax=Protopolystoma xenopodis TaxID=117903 RepID=A0A3S5A9I0_9PLAT|nr:unnamed protein product [Protopolystoma xenopodis]